MYDWVRKDLREFGNYIYSEKDLNELSLSKIDLAFIGSGLSSTHTLIEYINQISNQDQELLKTDLENPLRVVMFEKDSWIWGGIPYGRRSGYTSLIITPLDEFLPESELSIFIEWMSVNYNWLIAPFKKNPGDRSKQWLSDSEEKIISKDSAGIHIPRYFFGIYIWDKLKDAITKTSKNVKIDFVNSEVFEINSKSIDENIEYEILVGNKSILKADQVLLGVGIPQVRSLDSSQIEPKDILFLNDPYNPDLESSLQDINKYIESNTSTKILIVGANASALELIYQITNLSSFKENHITFTVISPQGKLPDLYIKNKVTDFSAENLENLYKLNENITADVILDALQKDLNYADANNYDISDTLPVFTNHVGNLIKKLSKKEKYEFISYHGVEIGRLQRRAGLEYTQPIFELIESKKLKFVKGKFTKLDEKDGKTMVNFINDEEHTKTDFFNVVINCAGSSGLTKDGMSPLLSQLKSSGICKPTKSNHGFQVNNKFQIQPGFFINGPLLAGNVVGEMGIWHVEHCGRIISFSKEIAKNMIDEKSSLNET